MSKKRLLLLGIIGLPIIALLFAASPTLALMILVFAPFFWKLRSDG